MKPSRAGTVAAVLAAALGPGTSRAWIYPEHRDIAVEGVARLTPGNLAALQQLWAEALPGYQAKLCPKLSEGEQGPNPGCIDFAAFPALSGDHSCSPGEVLERVLPSDWILGVARVSAGTKSALASAATREQRLNVVATNNLRLQVVDAEYVTRAGANNAHFLLPRKGDDLGAYLQACFADGAPLNALGLYGLYHVTALGLAQRLAAGEVPGAERASAAREVLALEGFALHWLEDIYSSGHDVGTWGDAAWRKGTHDYYSEFGLDSVDWRGRAAAAHGDANMKPADLDRGATAVSVSLTQLAGALREGDELGRLARQWGPGAAAVRAFNSCKENGQPSAKGSRAIVAFFIDQVQGMPKPALGPGEVHVPRFRDELGPFIGVFGAVSGGVGFGSTSGTVAGGTIDAGIRLGFGADSVTGSVGTGIAFIEAGFTASTAAAGPCGTGPGCDALGSAAFVPRIPAKTGMSFGIRVPFWVLPGDMLILGPVLALTSPQALSKVGVEAGSGGLIPYERSFGTAVGFFQVVAGREFRMSLFGYGLSSDPTAVLKIGTLPDGTPQYGVVQYKQIQLHFPVVEWTPFRTFATQLTFSAPIQLGFSVGLPSTTVLNPPTASYSASPVWTVWLRGIFDGRYFFGSREDLERPR